MKEMKNSKTPSYIKVGILTIITTLAWIVFGVYRTLTAEPSPNIPAQVLASFSPTLDIEKISAIEARTFFDEEEISSFIIVSPSPSPSPSPETTPTPTPEESPLSEETPEGSTESGELAP